MYFNVFKKLYLHFLYQLFQQWPYLTLQNSFHGMLLSGLGSFVFNGYTILVLG